MERDASIMRCIGIALCLFVCFFFFNLMGMVFPHMLILLLVGKKDYLSLILIIFLAELDRG